MTAKWQYKQAYEAVVEDVRRLRDENEKLSYAIQVMYDFLLSGKVDQCDLCDMAGTCENHPAPPPCKYDRMEESLMDWLHEQGIEVDEDD